MPRLEQAAQRPGRSRKTLPVTPVPVDPTTFDADTVIDGETVPDERAFDSHAGQARAFFSSSTGAGASTPRAPQDRPETDAGSSARDTRPDPRRLQRDALRRLRENTRSAGETYMESLRQSDILVRGFNDIERGKKLSALQKVYVQSMVMSCADSFRNGVNPASVTQAVGMMAAMYMLSPDFRDQVGEYAQPLRDHLRQRIDARAQSKWELAGKDSSQLSRKWQRRLDDYQYRARGHRHPYTAEMAGMTEVALAESAFRKMHEKDANIPELMESYEGMVSLLYKQAEADGLTREEVARAGRTVLGQRLEAEPELACMFEGLAHGMYRRSPAREVRLTEDGPAQSVWTGEFENANGHTMNDDSMFRPRPPMDGEGHQAWIAEMMKEGLTEAAERHDLAAFNEDMTGYMLGWATQRSPLEAVKTPERVVSRMRQSRVMLATMTIDGLNDERRREVYSNAYVDALERMGEQYPALSESWNLQYGENWRDVMREAVTNPEAALNEGWSATHDFGTHGPYEQPAGPHGNARSHGSGPEQPAGSPTSFESYQPA